MYFSYLYLPKLPEEFFGQCLENVKLIGVEPRLETINNYRGPMNRATILPREVDSWLIENIVVPLYGCVPQELKLNLLNVIYTNNEIYIFDLNKINKKVPFLQTKEKFEKFMTLDVKTSDRITCLNTNLI